MQVLERPLVGDVLLTHIESVRDMLARIPVDAVESVVTTIVEAHRRRQHVYIVGNGGSAATATHFACDLSKATIVHGRSRLRVTSLADNTAIMTAWANDTSYERVFAEQLDTLLNPGDVVIAISASGNSPNVLAAMETARVHGARTIAFVGFSGGALKSVVECAIHVPSNDYGVVEDCHLVLEHAITDGVRSALLG